MTKRDLVKWLERKKIEAVDKAAEAKDQAIKNAEELVYEKLGVDEFINNIYSSVSDALDKYEAYIEKVNSKSDTGISISPYHYYYGYNTVLERYGDKRVLRNRLVELIYIKTEDYNTLCSNLREDCRNVHRTYDTVIETVKNLPTAKDGIEYLKKLGFDISEIQPAEKKKQLPATMSVNVDVKYLLLNRKDPMH